MRYQGAHSDVLEKQKESEKSACYREVQNQLSSILGPTHQDASPEIECGSVDSGMQYHNM